MKARPQVTIEAVLELHVKLERRHPPGSPGRGAALEDVHRYLLRHADELRRRRRLPNARTDARSEKLVQMVFLEHQTGETNCRTLAKAVLGKTDLADGVEGLARHYGKMRRTARGLVEDILSTAKVGGPDNNSD